MAIGMTSLGHLGQPEDVADVVAFLAGPDGRWLTGQNIRANGGLCELRSRVVAVEEGRHGYGHGDGTRAGREIWSPRAVRGGSC
ncbi:enoyl-ACP reductase-like protein [Streptomyces sp. CEV 2-1]|nr:enoyl-ACP reductase-like protein [Streptomyces sp. CEV 2-1]